MIAQPPLSEQLPHPAVKLDGIESHCAPLHAQMLLREAGATMRFSPPGRKARPPAVVSIVGNHPGGTVPPGDDTVCGGRPHVLPESDDHMYMEYKYEKSKHQEDDVLTLGEYKVQNTSFLRQAYNEKQRKQRDEEEGK